MDDYGELMLECARSWGIEPSDPSVPEDRDVILNGIRLHWLDWGGSHLPPLLLLHGGSLTAHTWDMAVLSIRHKYHVIALDQRGHGDSEWTAGKYLEEDGGELMLEDTRQFIEYLGYDDLNLVGMSMGGTNAMRYASRYPARLKTLGIVDVAPATMSEGQREMHAFSEATADLQSFEDYVTEAKRFMPHRPEIHLRYSLGHSLKQVGDSGYTWKRDRRPRPSREESAEAVAARLQDRWDEVAAISVPTILFRGAESRILSPEVADRMIETLPQGELVVIPDATHNVHSDNPRVFSEALDRFLSSHV